MTSNISTFIAGILIAFSVLFGAQMQKSKTANVNSDFLSSKNQSLAEEKSLTGFFQDNVLRDQLIGLAALLHPSQIPRLLDVPPVRLSLAKDIPAPDFQIKAGLSIDESGKIFYAKNIEQKFPIASLTKLMTAIIVAENFKPGDTIAISKNAVSTYGKMGDLQVNEQISSQNLLYIMLLESSNDAAVAFAKALGQKNSAQPTASSTEEYFVGLMNKKAEGLGLANTYFADPDGLDKNTVSTADDLYKLTKAALENPLLRQILATEEINLYSIDGKIYHQVKTTNKLLGKITGIIAGKTGYTEDAGECLILVVENPQEKNYFMTIILGAGIDERFNETEKLVKWTEKVYGW